MKFRWSGKPLGGCDLLLYGELYRAVDDDVEIDGQRSKWNWRRSDVRIWTAGAVASLIREYCEVHGLPLKRFENWRAKRKHEDPRYRRKLLYRRNGDVSHRTSPMTNELAVAPATYIPSGRSSGSSARRNFGEAHKRRIVEEACCKGASISGVATKYGIAAAAVFRGRKELAPAPEAASLSSVGDDNRAALNGNHPCTSPRTSIAVVARFGCCHRSWNGHGCSAFTVQRGQRTPLE